MSETRPLRVATFNIQHGSDGVYDHPGDPDLTAEVCRQLGADILGIQEADRGIPRSQKVHMAKRIAEVCDMDFYFAPTRSFRGRGRFGNALLVKGEIKNVSELKFRGDWQCVNIGSRRQPLLPEPRKAIVADVTSRGYELASGVIHAGGKTRRDMLALSAAVLLARGGPWILLGDFNTRIKPARETLQPLGLELITTSFPPEMQSPNRNQPQIDHIAIRDLRCVSSGFVPVPISDHEALVADLLPI